MDVAACFLALLNAWPDVRRALDAAFEETNDDIPHALALLVALYDAGKFAILFQAKDPDAFPVELGPWQLPPACRHDAVGLSLALSKDHLQPLIASLFSEKKERMPAAILNAVFGHHGQPVGHDVDQLEKHMGSPGGPASSALKAFAEAAQMLLGRPRLPPLRRNAERALSWRLAGIVALADWLGSDQSIFAYEPATLDPERYWREYALPRAEEALARSGLIPASIAQCGAADVLLPAGMAPSAAQRWAAEVDITERGLFLIEDVMGSGKTEAALILAWRLMQAERGAGLYLALPTMATANALYRRMARLYRKLFTQEARPSLVLAHGGRDLDPAFQASLGLAESGRDDEAYGTDLSDETATAACVRWLGDDRRKALLADVGVGTIDQALLAMLPVKHACVRQIGLSRRIVIVDEAHSYDFYVQRELEELIAHQARLGAPVIILSATLPSAVRDRLLSAYARGAGSEAKLPAAVSAYPLATAMGAALVEMPLPARADLSRKVALRRLGSPEAAEALVAEAAGGGAAVAYLRNTVDDALESYDRLAAMGLQVELFHARFAMGDRLDIENRVVARFGRRGTCRNGRVLVATQVVEQSIDLDLDLLVTDLAPADLVLQRMGRMWRHARSDRGWPRPELAVVSPEPVAEPGPDWYAALFPRAQWVYRDHALLWRSARELFARDVIGVPDDLRGLVEAVYDPAALDAAPAALQRSGSEALGVAVAGRQAAALNVLTFEKGYLPESGGWGPDTVTPTRLGDERRVLRLCRLDEGRLRPWCADADEARAWALSEVSVRANRIAGRAPISPDVDAQAAALEARWAERGVQALAIYVQSDGLAPQLGCVRYASETGLVWNFHSS